MRELALVLILGAFSFSAGQILQNGQCDPDISLQQNFDIEQFLGVWYEQRRGANPLQGGDCSYMEFLRNGDTLTYYNRALNKNFLEEVNGQITNDGPKLTLTLDGDVSTPLDLWVLAVDSQYDTYALVYRCENIGSTQRLIYLWQLSRTTEPPSALIDALISTTLRNLFDGLTTDDLENVDNSEQACYELPVIGPNQPIILPGQCDPDLRGVDAFDAQAFTGEWHEIASYFSENIEGTCPRAQYSLEDSTVNVVNSEVVGTTLREITGTATVISEDGSAKLNVVLEVPPGSGVYVEQELYILATDYTSYAVSYTCVNVDANNKRVNSWIASRSRDLTPDAEEAVNGVLDRYLDLNQAYFQSSARTDEDCFYFPEPETGKVVTFRGQCDLNIPVVQDFDVASYLGLWHDTASYPSAFQDGTCNNARYSLIEGTDPPVVDVYNTMVINERLDTINGEARVASDDGSAKLSVTFPTAPFPSSYWVLDTDYESFALVYSCAQIDDDTRSVYAWKLSRTKQLPEAAQIRINAIIDTIDVLQEQYFETKDQSPEGCFYYPEAISGEPVIFPGVCATDIPVVQDFNFANFAGTWNEIAAYPKEFQPSNQCIKHDWTAGTDNTFSLRSSSIVNQFLIETESTVSSSDSSARLTIRLNNQDVEIPFWIIDTDYDDFALAYSCVNVDDNPESRAVYSWKLSRTTSLSAAAEARINTAIATINVLGNDYYESIGQTNDDCFYLPVLEEGEPVIIPGQCDPNIEVVKNFDAGRYLGLWHMIETYPSSFQNGECGQATYSLNQTDGSVIAENAEVRDQSLFIQIGRGTVIPSDDGSAKLSVTFPDAPEPIEYWVLSTDYESHSLVYSCVNINENSRQVFSWKLSRTKSLTPEANVQIDEVINQVNVLNSNYYKTVDNSDEACFYYPEVTGGPVLFRGQCDQSIPTVADFDPVRYMGQWYDIESYPSDYQGGSCNSAFYTLNLTSNDAFVDVYNTQVVDQKLDEIYGIAVPVPGESGKLLVEFPGIENPYTPADYWVLDTDYDTYALVYTCANIGPDTRLVFTWKLSRTRELPITAQNNINAIISTIPVLDERYYVQKDHSADGCFYYPEPQQGVPVVFPGTCDENIPVIENFDFARFAGTWNEIAAYPKEFQPSNQCIKHEWTAGTGNTFSLESSSVVNQFLIETESTVSSSDSSGRLTIRLNNQDVEIPFWIIDTDYTEFALAYSCVNVETNPERRAVYSWKLSRTNSLSVAAEARIDTAIETINVLDNDYYEPIGQTDDDCFYLPVLEEGEPVIIPGQCDPNIEVVKNFDAGRYLGLWHMIETYSSSFQSGECGQATYSLDQTDGSVIAENAEVRDQSLFIQIGRGTVIPSDDGSAKLSVTFPDAPEPIEYWVLSTDYESYSLVYSCVNINENSRQVFSWKLSRTKSLTPEASAQIDEVINEVNVLNSNYYKTVDNSDEACFYYPEVTGGPVLFRGQCDQSIPTVADFDPARYMGQWYDIESYPSDYQGGSCNSAFYTLNLTSNDPFVDVYNTQVVDQRLEEMYGIAVPVPGESGKLLVEFPGIENPYTPADYWVLDTDYDTYALVYTCANIGPDTRLVFTWKLSRTRELPITAQNNINAIISTIPVLDERYYVQKDHSTDGCFYYPEPQEGVPVVFPGTCDENIPVIENFDFARFAGTWNEIAAYPKEFQPSNQCIKHDWIAGTGNTFSLESSSIINQFLIETESTVSSSDSSGRLTIRLNNQDVEIPFWIIDTDYTDFALAYSCVNVATNPERRAVYSWKLSRSTSLSSAADDRINTAIATINVLDNDYYEPIGQTEDDCFYLPVLGEGESVIFPGQCDPNIEVVKNFDAGSYLGLWHMIETYPSFFQSGECGQATYSLNQTDGTVIAENAEVRDQSLFVQIGRGTVIPSDDGSAKLSVTFPDAPDPIEYWILSTDYVSFSLVYSCVNINENSRQVWSWKLSRTKSLTPEATTQIDEVINQVNVLNSNYYRTVDNSDEACFYYPEVTGGPVLFPGQCDQSIPTVADFDAARYMGQWYDIESYPSDYQGGSCNSAFYTLNLTSNDPFVDVYNTQVVDQRLEEMYGIAVPVPGESGKLLVEFPGIENPYTPADYWVLDTDYDTYALVYTCANIGPDSRLVFTWKLSRTRELPVTAQNNINAIINTIPVLDERYYVQKDHSADGCFYYPEPQEGVPVQFPGTCDDNIPVIENLDLGSFLGTWYEIETYPKEFAPGQCISHSYTASSATNTMNLATSAVADLSLMVSQSTVTAPSIGSAKLTITMQNGISIPFWIIDTDYDDYALAYSCVDLEYRQGFRGVYSWKLSRSKRLSDAANARIDNAIQPIDVLDEMYYEDVDQTNEGCFYYPELNENEPVVFPGQCDSNLAAISNFDAQRFSGRWFDIESYFDDDYQGGCVDGTFNLNTNNNGFDVVFTQVIDETLITATSSATIAVDGSGILTVTSSGGTFEFLVLATDYDNYALIYSCNNIDEDSRRVRSWKMSRTRALSDSSSNAISAVIATIDVLDERYYNAQDHSKEACFYFPEPVPGQPRIFRGDCDETYNVVPNFDVAAYLGTWYEIESYPNEYQGGTCSTAEYSLSPDLDGVVIVKNSQVVDQQLEIANGTAIVAPDADGYAKLIVSFPIPGTELETQTPYWVLATDYEDYALVYSCNQIDDEYYRIGSWKLSRERTLSVAAQTSINNAMSQVRELQQEYYEESGHTDDSCFYYPQLWGAPIILEGSCPNSEDVAAVTNFDASRFTGTWYEVARFPSELLQVECASNEIELYETNLVLSTKGVKDQELYVASTELTLVTAGRGTYRATFGTGNSAITVDLNILDTDYDGYALIYGCRPLEDDRKQIFSWKLSKSQSGLSEAANERINEIVRDTEDLFELYYETTDQSTDACFYYPKFDEIPDVITMPGPCPNVAGVPGFDAGRYLGRWFEIERYPQADQSGTCSQAIYRLGTDQVDVENTQVVDQELDVQLGSAVVKESAGDTGVLEVTFIVNGVTVMADYYILATDYDNYALVYSCRDRDDGNMDVYSWKLSRERQLSDEAKTAINNKIEETRGLLDEYYVQTSQTDEDCFYVPEFDATTAPVFRGSCEPITPIQNFDRDAFIGWWHEVQRYPVDGEIGECLSSRYEVNNQGGIEVVDTNVFSATSATYNYYQVTISDTGVITRVPTGRYEHPTTYQVLATDYNTYALVYSCTETDETEFGDTVRTVWSSIYSRTPEIPTAQDINDRIQEIQVLDDKFYINVTQTDEACFHYPEPNQFTSGNVILRGQCDDNIPVQPNFDLDAYTGTWYEIERYNHPQFSNSATCVGTRYTIPDDYDTTNELIMTLWHVEGTVLDYVEGTARLADDGSARFTVTVGESSATLHILQTDYTSYAVAMTCQNLNAFERSVVAFKLSRGRYLPDSAVAAITALTAQTAELHQPYFNEITQSEDCEEPSSSYLVRSSIIVMLICAAWQIVFNQSF